MKLLKDILYHTRILDVIGQTNIAIEHVALDSRQVRSFSLFVAVRGTLVNGHDYIPAAIAGGAVAVVCEALPDAPDPRVTYVKVSNAGHALGQIASNFYDQPSQQLKLVAVTGTNGKTTTVSLLFDLFRLMGFKVGKLSTVENRINKEVLPATHTTPDALTLNKLLRQMVDAGCKYCFMEASSHAIHQHRISGLAFTGAVFTNITHDHLDYHKTFNDYIHAKKLLFDGLPTEAFALYNADDKHGETMVQDCKGRINSYGLKSMTDFRGRIIENQFSGLHVQVDGMDLYSTLIGGFNAYNLMAVYATAVLLGLTRLDVLTTLSNLKPAEGRFQHVKTPSGITAIIDYAHTPDALQNVLKTIQDIRDGNEQVITVVGCGGNRDKTKRPEMARIAASLSNRLILTSDNPRDEDPKAILNEMEAGLDILDKKKSIAIEDRREAIKLAVREAQPGDIILIAGKGHEKYQEIKGEKLPFDDVQVVNETLKMLEK